MGDDPLKIAQSAAENAAAFADLLATRLADVAGALRNGEDAPALNTLGESTDDLEQFLTFLVLTSEMLDKCSPATSTGLRDYRERLMKVLETLGPALQDMDLVEVADTLEHDVVSSLGEYRDLDDQVQSALRAAA
ncbi:MAG: hypothetical protein V3V08_13665 [Nannocystaceae bacterium]